MMARYNDLCLVKQNSRMYGPSSCNRFFLYALVLKISIFFFTQQPSKIGTHTYVTRKGNRKKANIL